MEKQKLTKAEEQVMQVLWELDRGFLKNIIEKFPQPAPAYTTVSTVIRVLVKKGFVGFRTYGKINEYYPLITKAQYFNSRIKPSLSSYLEDPAAIFASYFSNAKLDLADLEEIKQLIDEKIKKLKTKKK